MSFISFELLYLLFFKSFIINFITMHTIQKLLSPAKSHSTDVLNTYKIELINFIEVGLI